MQTAEYWQDQAKNAKINSVIGMLMTAQVELAEARVEVDRLERRVKECTKLLAEVEAECRKD